MLDSDLLQQEHERLAEALRSLETSFRRRPSASEDESDCDPNDDGSITPFRMTGHRE